jgi:hypothetical protein
MILATNVTIGADPELFIVNEKTGTVVSSIGIIPGEKGNPWRSDDMPEGFGIEIDNILAEFNIPPVTTKEGFVNNIQYMKGYINKFVKNINPDLGILCSASQMVPTDQLKSKEARMFGCDPDYNVYTESENPRPKGNSTNLRSAGFHIHVGYDDYNIETSTMLIRYLDAYLGIPSVIMDPDTRRRSLYGKAGSFRLTDYGCEWRILSSAMMKDVSTLEAVWNGIKRSINALNNFKPLPSSDEVITCINGSDANLAKELIRKYNLMYSCVE